MLLRLYLDCSSNMAASILPLLLRRTEYAVPCTPFSVCLSSRFISLLTYLPSRDRIEIYMHVGVHMYVDVQSLYTSISLNKVFIDAEKNNMRRESSVSSMCYIYEVCYIRGIHHQYRCWGRGYVSMLRMLLCIDAGNVAIGRNIDYK